MEPQTMLDSLNIYVSSQKIPLSPDTGGFSELGTVETIFGIAAITCIIFASVFLLFRKKIFRKNSASLTPSIVLFFLATALAIPATSLFSTAKESATNLYVTTNANAPVIASAEKEITLNADYPYGFSILAHLDTEDSALYNDDLSAKIQPTEFAISPEEMTLNSYGIKINIDGFNAYSDISTDENNADFFYISPNSAKSGDTITLEYIAKLDNTVKEGTYSTQNTDAHFIYEIYPGQPIPVSTQNDGYIDAYPVVVCIDDVCTDIEGNKYIEITYDDNLSYYVYAYDVTFDVSPEDYGTINLEKIENIPHGSGITLDPSDDASFTINDTKITATPAIATDEYTYSFDDWDFADLTVDGIISDMTFTANFTRAKSVYAIALDAGEDVEDTDKGTETIYVTYGEKFTLDASSESIMSTIANPIIIPVRSGYDFGGYYTSLEDDGTQFIDAEGHLAASANSTFFTQAKSEANELTLYALWTETPSPVPADFFAITYMQEMTPEICTTATTPANTATTPDTDGTHKDDNNYIPTITLKDIRDEQLYTIKKLADGRCWMANNLNLALNANTTLTKNTTDLNTVDSWTPSLSTLSSLADWSLDNSKAFTPQSIRPATETNYDDNFGTYYSWNAAVASNNTSGISSTPANSICPKGWQLPTRSSSNASDYWSFLSAYGYTSRNPMSSSTGIGSAILNFPLNLNFPGTIENTSYSTLTGKRAYYWMNSYNSDNAYAFTISADIYSSTNGIVSRNTGASIRCIAR